MMRTSILVMVLCGFALRAQTLAPLADVSKAAEQGDAAAQFKMGSAYLTGAGVPKDAAEALKWYRRAADQGNLSAQFNVGTLYAAGRGVAQDNQEAVRWFRKAAEQGNAPAQAALGALYAKGQGVAQDYQEAERWYRKAAEQGNPAGEYNLATLYTTGHGVAQDAQEAVRWYRKAAEQGEPNAQAYLGFLYNRGQGLAQDNQEAVRWFRKAAEQGNAYAQGTLGVLYYNGTGVAQDYQEAVRWYRKAAEQGNPAAQGNLGGVYSTGQGVAQDYVEAWMWLSLAVMRSDGDDRKKWAAARAAVAQKITPQQVTEAERRVREWKPAEGSPSESISPMPAAAPAAPAGTPVTAAAPSFAPKRAGSALAAGPRPAVAVKRPCFLVRSSNGTFSANGKELFWTVRYTTAGCPESEFPLNVRVTLHFRNKAEVEVGTLVSPLDAVVLAAGTVPSKSLIKAKPVGVAGPNELVHGHVSVPKEIFRQTFTLGATAEVLK